MAFIAIDEMVDDAVAVALDAEGKRIRIVYGASRLSLDVGEAVDLVTELAGVLAEVFNQTELRRNEDEIRAAATIREAL